MRPRIILGVAVAVILAGTIGFAQKQGRVVESTYSESWTGLFTSCYDDKGILLFDVMEHYEMTWRDMTRYDQNGKIAQVVRTVRFPEDVLWNSETEKSLTGGPGLRNEVRFIYNNGVLVSITSSGPVIRFNVPGYGPVFIETGHAVYDGNHLPVSNSGHNDYRDWDPAALEAVCNAVK